MTQEKVGVLMPKPCLLYPRGLGSLGSGQSEEGEWVRARAGPEELGGARGAEGWRGEQVGSK